ncbi:sensor kinase SpoOB-type protein [Melghirimyces profundicolus]|uniref:Sensor kinase SpoOB-type protein n=1 Tax=Melghirimyces profundicolus TaxID=1242148 RepID=A0A2T6BTJ7_9BACL|nr:Spo0B domain-containing protein [Melghirimyces profundicolus]PTX59405.1 sensor kinase SpoOB-type protein [Melghirimyces profundicolus]
MAYGWSVWLKRAVPLGGGLLLLSVQPWGWPVGIPMGLSLFAVILWGLRHQEREWEERTRRDRIRSQLRLISRQRHDCMNHIQVLLGYVSLGRTERIAPYLQELSERLTMEREASRVGSPSLALALITLNQRFPEWRWVTDIDEEAARLPQGLGECARLSLMETAGWLQEYAESDTEPADVYLKLIRKNGDLRLTLQPEWEPASVKTGDWEGLREKLSSEGIILESSGPEEGIRIRIRSEGHT